MDLADLIFKMIEKDFSQVKILPSKINPYWKHINALILEKNHTNALILE